MRAALACSLVVLVCIAGLAAAGCGAKPAAAPAAPAPQPTQAPAAAPAPTQAAPTTEAPAPAAAAPAATVVVEKAVEKRVVITTPTPSSAASTSEGEADWARIRSAGKLLAGISTGYPPFAVYAASSQADGFDVALAEEVARRLGLGIEFKDFPLDGLPGALQLGQVDLAASALAPTAAGVRFGSPYLLIPDAILARPSVSVRAIQDFAGRKVGVRRGSAQEAWARSALVTAGVIQDGDLRVYETIEQAAGDLRQARIDLLVLDGPAARPLVQAGKIEIAGQGLNPQPLAMAVASGSVRLAAEVDRALADLWQDGTMARLAEQYLGLTAGQVARPPAATSEQVVATPAGCVDGMAWVRDLTFDDRGMTVPPEVAAGQRFVKGWRVRNAGTCDWTSRYALAFVQGNSPLAQMGSAPAAIDGPVPAGAEHEIYAELVAPAEPGVHQAFWQMHNAEGVPFGERVWVGVRVAATPTPPPSLSAAPTQLPVGTFMADRTSVQSGECVTFQWSFENIREIFFGVQGQPDSMRGVMGQDSGQECPQASTVYELRAVRPDGCEEVRRIPVAVGAAAGLPVSIRFSINPATEVRAGDCVELAWEVQGDVAHIFIFRGDQQIGSDAPFSGSVRDCPPGAGDLTYVIQASRPGGPIYARKEIRIVQ